MIKTLLIVEDHLKERKERLIRKPTYEELCIRGLESMEKEQEGFNLSEKK